MLTEVAFYSADGQRGPNQTAFRLVSPEFGLPYINRFTCLSIVVDAR